MAFKNSTGKLTTTKYGEPYLWGSGDVTTLPSNKVEKLFTYNTPSSSSAKIGNNRIIVSDKNDNTFQGAVYIYNLDGTNETKITASDGANQDYFGNSIAIGNGKIVVGAPSDDDNGGSSGSAYIFDLDGNQLAKITASDAAGGDFFGTSVDVGCGRIVVGATGDDDNGSASGSAYIFDLDGNQLAKITASDGAASDNFGSSVAIGNGRIVVGATGDDDNGSASGSAYIFSLDGIELAKITDSDGAANDFFGSSVAIGNGRIVVGAPGSDVQAMNGGKVLVFDLNCNLLYTLLPTDPSGSSTYGDSLSIKHGRIVIGSSNKNIEVNGSLKYVVGKVYIYDLDGNELTTLLPTNLTDGQYFGLDVGVSNGKILILKGSEMYIYDTPLVYTPHDLIYNEV